MASFLLVFAIAAMGLIVFWYAFDEAARGGTGATGILGMVDPSSDERGARGAPGWKAGSGRRPWRAGRGH